MAHTCRGTINLASAHIDTEDSCGILLCNGARTYHLKAGSEVDRQQWITVLELAKAKAIRVMKTQSGSAHSARCVCVTGATVSHQRKWESKAFGNSSDQETQGSPVQFRRSKACMCPSHLVGCTFHSEGGALPRCLWMADLGTDKFPVPGAMYAFFGIRMILRTLINASDIVVTQAWKQRYWVGVQEGVPVPQTRFPQ